MLGFLKSQFSDWLQNQSSNYFLTNPEMDKKFYLIHGHGRRTNTFNTSIISNTRSKISCNNFGMLDIIDDKC